MDKHPTKYTSADVFELSDRLMFAASSCGDEKLKELLREGGKVLLNRETLIAQIRIMIGKQNGKPDT